MHREFARIGISLISSMTDQPISTHTDGGGGGDLFAFWPESQ